MRITLIILALLASLVTLAGCEDKATEMHFPAMPSELKDCKFFRLSNNSGDGLTVARCPNSTTVTTYPSGKTHRSTVVVDGTTYEEKEK